MAKQNNKEKSEEKKIFGLTEKQRSWLYTALFVTAFLVFFIVNNSRQVPEEGPYPPSYEAKIDPGSRPAAPEFNLETPDGGSISLSDFKGKVVILDFWATWCAPCRRAIPELIEIKKQFADTNFDIIGISLDTDTKENVAPFVKNMGMNYPVGFGDMTLTQQYGGIRSIPTSFVLDQEGRIYSRYVGYVNKEVYLNDIKQLMSETK